MAYIAIVVGAVGCDGSRILAILPQASVSHQNTYRPIFRELANRGHDITYVTSLPVQDPPYKQIVVSDPVLENMAGKFHPLFATNVCHYIYKFLRTYIVDCSVDFPYCKNNDFLKITNITQDEVIYAIRNITSEK